MSGSDTDIYSVAPSPSPCSSSRQWAGCTRTGTPRSITGSGSIDTRYEGDSDLELLSLLSTRAAYTLLRAHGTVVDIYRRKYQPTQRGTIGIVIVSPHVAVRPQSRLSLKGVRARIGPNRSMTAMSADTCVSGEWTTSSD